MKNTAYLLVITMILGILSTGCSNVKTTLSPREYIYSVSTEPYKPRITIQENNRFTFIYSSLSSYIAIGTYEIKNEMLILKTDDGEKKFVFHIDYDTFVFNSEESSEIPSYANLPDGAVFQ